MVLTGTGRIVFLYAIDATAAGYFADTTHWSTLVPTGKRWKLKLVQMYRAVSSTANIYLYDGTRNAVSLNENAAATGTASWPGGVAAVTNIGTPASDIILDEGQGVQVTFGVAQNSSSWGCVLVEEYSL